MPVSYGPVDGFASVEGHMDQSYTPPSAPCEVLLGRLLGCSWGEGGMGWWQFAQVSRVVHVETGFLMFIMNAMQSPSNWVDICTHSLDDPIVPIVLAAPAPHQRNT